LAKHGKRLLSTAGPMMEMRRQEALGAVNRMNPFALWRDQERRGRTEPQEPAMMTNLVLFLACAPLWLLVVIGAGMFALVLPVRRVGRTGQSSPERA
jgi:hypothetical protein